VQAGKRIVPKFSEAFALVFCAKALWVITRSMTDPLENKATAAKAGQSEAEDRGASGRGKPKLSAAEEQRRLRVAAKLRENLARRKQQARARRAGEAEDGEGLPAANSSNPDATAVGDGTRVEDTPSGE
jgi:hypothetical protein